MQSPAKCHMAGEWRSLQGNLDSWAVAMMLPGQGLGGWGQNDGECDGSVSAELRTAAATSW